LLERRLRRHESVIDDETEMAVDRWVRLADQLIDRTNGDGSARCSRCGTTYRVLESADEALCARCYLERGESAAP
jgi:protein-arginine kinase activator protein McsA